MKLGIISQNLLHLETVDEGLQCAHDLGFRAIEVGALALWNQRFCNVEKLIKDGGEIARWKDTFAKYDLEISALGGHGAPLTPTRRPPRNTSRSFAEPAASWRWPTSDGSRCWRACPRR